MMSCRLRLLLTTYNHAMPIKSFNADADDWDALTQMVSANSKSILFRLLTKAVTSRLIEFVDENKIRILNQVELDMDGTICDLVEVPIQPAPSTPVPKPAPLPKLAAFVIEPAPEPEPPSDVPKPIVNNLPETPVAPISEPQVPPLPLPVPAALTQPTTTPGPTPLVPLRVPFALTDHTDVQIPMSESVLAVNNLLRVARWFNWEDIIPIAERDLEKVLAGEEFSDQLTVGLERAALKTKEFGLV